MKKLVILLILFINFLTTFAQNISEKDFANEKLQERGEFYFSFDKPSQEILNQLSEIISIDNVNANKIFAYANKNEFSRFLDFHIQFVPTYDYYANTKATTMATTIEQMANWNRYPTFTVYQQMLQNYATNYPNICRLDTIGFSAVNNRPLLCLVISDNVNEIEDEPEFSWSATIHGDELCGWILEMRFADYLLSNYGSNSQVNNIVNNSVVYICPLANPDGTYRNSSEGTSVTQSTRYNGNNVDLNRSFPNINGSNYVQGSNADSTQSEVRAMEAYANLHNFTMAANLHGGASVINYPWDLYGANSTNIRPADENWWLYVCHVYADLAIANSQGHSYSGYPYFKDIRNNGITEGSDWYWISGSRQDYMNFFKHCREVTLEVSVEKRLDVGELNNHWNFNRQAMLDYTEQILYGFRGIITDACTGQPISGVKIEISGHDEMGSEVYSFAPLGNYFRPIYAGTYNVTFFKDGYISQTQQISVTNNNSSILNVSLIPELPNDIANFTINSQSCIENVEFCAYFQDAASYLWNFGDGTTSTDINPLHSYQQNGNYSVSLTVCGQEYSRVFSALLLLTPVITNESNIGTGDGSITVNVQGGTPNYEGLWGTGQTSYGEEMMLPNLQAGTYSITVSDASNCSDSIINMQVTFLTGIEQFKKSDLQIYPNPSKGTFYVESGNNIKEIEIYNILGTKILSENLDENIVKYSLKLKAGHYFLKIKDSENQRIIRKLIIE